MIRVTQTFTCAHPPLQDPLEVERRRKLDKLGDGLKRPPKNRPPADPIKTLAPHRPVVVESQGHSVVLEQRVCLCTGSPLLMVAKVEHNDPEAGKPH